MSFNEIIIKHKNLSRKESYVSYKNFMCLNDFEFDYDNFKIYSGYLNIPKGSDFYIDICIKNNIDFTDKDETLSFLLSSRGIKIVTKEFTKIFISQPRKYLKKNKIFDKELLLFLISVKISSKELYIKTVKKMDNEPSIVKAKLIVSYFYV